MAYLLGVVLLVALRHRPGRRLLPFLQQKEIGQVALKCAGPRAARFAAIAQEIRRLEPLIVGADAGVQKTRVKRIGIVAGGAGRLFRDPALRRIKPRADVMGKFRPAAAGHVMFARRNLAELLAGISARRLAGPERRGERRQIAARIRIQILLNRQRQFRTALLDPGIAADLAQFGLQHGPFGAVQTGIRKGGEQNLVHAEILVRHGVMAAGGAAQHAAHQVIADHLAPGGLRDIVTLPQMLGGKAAALGIPQQAGAVQQRQIAIRPPLPDQARRLGLAGGGSAGAGGSGSTNRPSRLSITSK